MCGETAVRYESSDAPPLFAVWRHMNKLKLLCMIAAPLVAVACSDSAVTAPIHPTDSDVSGAWVQPFGGVPGNSLDWNLTAASGAVTGTGTFRGEAGPFGTLAISGNVANDTLRLKVIYNYDATTFPSLHPDTAQFVGVLASRDDMIGKYTRQTQTSDLHMVRPTQ